MKKIHIYRATAVYAVVSLLYISFSDSLVYSLWPDPANARLISTLKGWGFVILTAALLAGLLLRLAARETNRYRALLDNHYAIILVVDPQSSRVVDASDAAVRFYGWPREQLLKRHITDINTLSQTEIQAEMQHARRNEAHVFHFRHRLASGEVRDVDVHSGPIVLDGQDRLLSFVKDVTEQRRNEVELHRMVRLYDILSATNKLVLRARNANDLYQDICRIAVDRGGFLFCWIGLRQADDTVTPVAMAGEDHGYMRQMKVETLSDHVLGQGPTGTAIRDGRHVISNDFLQNPATARWHEAARAAGIGASAAFPFAIGGQWLGSLNLYAGETNYFGSKEVQTLEEVAADISFGLANIQHMATLETLADVIDTSPVVLFRWRAAPGWPVAFVSSNVAQWGYQDVDLINGKITFETIVHPEDLSKVSDEVAEYTAHGVERFRQEYRIRKADGEVRWVADVTTIERDEDGAPRFYKGTLTDITLQRLAKNELAASEQRLRRILDHSPDLVFVNRDDKVYYINPKGLQLLKASSPDQVLGMSIYALFDPESHAAIKARIAMLSSNLGCYVPAAYEPMLALDGSRLDTSVTAVSFMAEDHIDIMVTCRDISDKRRAEETIAAYVKHLENAVLGTASAVSQMVELRDPYTAGHERRVGELATAIAAEMGLDENLQNGLRIAGAVHDVGKIVVPAEILTKPGKLTSLEFELVKEHAEQGYQVLKDVDFPWPVAQVARQHHERLDGSGYPQGLKGDAILLEARIIAVADVVESMSSHRPYRPARGPEAALAEIEKGAGRLFDPQAVAACLRLFRDKGYTLPN